MQRREFLHALTASATLALSAAPNAPKVLVCLLDGFGPEYLERSDMPFLKRLIREGTFAIGEGVMPSVTNVNNASLATAAFPARHGITANTFYDRARREVVEMSDPRYLLAPTCMNSGAALVAAKAKVRSLLGARTAAAYSCEKPAPEAIAIAGPAPSMYTPDADYWCFRLGRTLLRRPEIRLLYLTTTDYMMHTYAPDQPQPLAHLHRLDQLLAELRQDHTDLEIYLTADHGMNAKHQAIDPVRILAAHGLESLGVPPIRDAHRVHHQDLGGSLNIELSDPRQASRAADLLRAEKGIDGVYLRDEAARKFSLHPGRIGDLFLTADRHTALGLLPQTRQAVTVRTHGSTHETAVPLLIHGAKSAPVRQATVGQLPSLARDLPR